MTARNSAASDFFCWEGRGGSFRLLALPWENPEPYILEGPKGSFVDPLHKGTLKGT